MKLTLKELAEIERLDKFKPFQAKGYIIGNLVMRFKEEGFSYNAAIHMANILVTRLAINLSTENIKL